ncbi:MAG: hypothetical protein EOP10_05680 [Proteobacteria bacterium]|nr:MAG: hypothetical protein EOP10_05680 [Pseudomonadota bacterium]
MIHASPLRMSAALLAVLISCSQSPERAPSSRVTPSAKDSKAGGTQPSVDQGDSKAGDGKKKDEGSGASEDEMLPSDDSGNGDETPDNEKESDKVEPKPDTGSTDKDVCKSGSRCLDFNTVTNLTAIPSWKEAAPNCKGTSTLNLDKVFDPKKEASLRVDAKGGICNHLFLAYSEPEYFQANNLYIRFYWAIAKPLNDAHVTFVTMHDSKENKDIRWGGQAKVSSWNRESDDATVPTLSPQGIQKSFTPKASTFHCVELHIDQSKALIETKIDGVLIEGLSVTPAANREVDEQWKRKANYSLALQDLKLGYEDYGSVSNTVWYKDVVLGTAPIGCK